MWNFLGMDPNFLGALVFYIFDDDQTNSLEYDEIRILVETIHHKSDKNVAIRKLIETIMQNHSTVTVEHFTKCCREMSSLCAPLIGMQQSLREKVIGVNYWIDLTARRGQDPVKSRPNFIKILSDSIANKRLQKEVNEIERNRQEEKEIQKAAMIQRKKRTQGKKRRRSSYLVQFFVGDGTGATAGAGTGTGTGTGTGNGHTAHLPTKPRARRSSVSLLKPSLLKEKELKPKFFKNQVQPDFDGLEKSKRGIGQQSSNVGDLTSGESGTGAGSGENSDLVRQFPLSVSVTDAGHDDMDLTHTTTQSHKQKSDHLTASNDSSARGKSSKSRQASRGESLGEGASASPIKKSSSAIGSPAAVKSVKSPGSPAPAKSTKSPGSPAVKASKSRLPRGESSESSKKSSKMK
jgi:hypothetical protein